MPGDLRVLGRHQAFGEAVKCRRWVGVDVSCSTPPHMPWSSWCVGGREINRVQMHENRDFEVEQSSCGATRGGAGAGVGVAAPPFRRAKVRHKLGRCKTDSLGAYYLT